MKRILPYEIPPVETYQSDAFFLGICLSYNRSKNVYINRFINLQCNNSISMKQIDIRFANSLWGDLYNEGTGELNLFHFCNYNMTTLIKFMEERIDQNCYLLLYEVDEYYLSYTDSYKKKHYKHDTYIYGYDDDNFYIVAYSNKRLQKLEVNKKEIVNSVLKTNINDIDNFCSFRINQAANILIDVKSIINGLHNYCDGESGYDDTSFVYGINVWNVVIESINSLNERKQFEEKELDLRIMRLIWEHKKSMCYRLEQLNDKEIEISDVILEKLREIEKQAYLAFQLFFKYMIENNHS